MSEERRTSALEAMHEEEALGKAYDTRLLGRLWPYVWPYRWQVLLTLLLVGPLLAVELAPAWIVKTGLDHVLLGDGSTSSEGSWLLRGPSGVSSLAWLSGLLLLTMLSRSVLQFVYQYVINWTGLSAMRDLREVVFAHIQRLHQGFFDRYPVGRLVTRCTNDIENLNEMFASGIVALVTDVLRMVVIATALFRVDATLAGFTFLVIPPLAVFALVFRFKVRQAYRQVRVRIARINAYIQENVTGMREVQLFTREARNYRDFEQMNADHRDAWFQSIRYDSALFSIVELASNVTIAIILWKATDVATAGIIFVFIDWLRLFFQPLRDLAAKYSVMQSSMASAERIFELLDTEPAVKDLPHALPLRDLRVSERRGVVEFENVSFAYSGDRGEETEWVLRDLSFRVEAGEKVALVGPTGAGKTSVLKLLTRLYEPVRGRILLDGLDLRELTQEHLRRRVAMVLQDVFLFSGSVAENIGLDRPDIDRGRIAEVAAAVQAQRFIERLPEGFDTPLRERGTNLSAGQRQLLSFARALAHGADVLVLDEATSSIDSETEALVQEGIHTLMEGRTALVVAHRLSTIQDVDRIYVMQAGRLVEAGTHEELLALGGLYERLYRLQYETSQGAPVVAAGG